MGMWKVGSCEQELFEGMKSAEVEAVEKEEMSNDSNFLEALEELNAAAECFERAGKIIRAQEITALMMSLASDKKPKPKKNVSSKDEAKKVFMFFGFSPKDLEGANLAHDGECEDEDM